MKVPNPTGKWLVQIGKGSGRYTTKYALSGGKIYNPRALLYYNSINIGNGYKKRLVQPDGTVIARVLS